jgi:hypothetical protein
MPRKRRRGQIVDATGEVLKVVRLELPEKLHDAFRIEAAKARLSMAALARKWIEERLKRTKGAEK